MFLDPGPWTFLRFVALYMIGAWYHKTLTAQTGSTDIRGAHLNLTVWLELEEWVRLLKTMPVVGDQKQLA